MPDHPPPAGFLATLGIELLTLALAAWFGAKVIARPIQQLSQAATELGDNVDRPPIEEVGTEEARQAARAFNRMQARLREQIAARGRFLAAVSHDLRTPLTRMRLRVERLAQDDKSQKLREDVREMSAMLDATLNYLRGEAQTEAPRMLDVYALVSSMVEDYQEQGLAITVSGAAAPIMAQATALQRCLMNLMENALRYGEQASVEVRESEAQLIIEIRDRGAGIPADKLEAVMEPFYRLESSRNKATGGVGLGLSIAREAIQRQGGGLSLRNAEEGGLIATVTLPKARTE
jgi:protein-histidine pros-kinase